MSDYLSTLFNLKHKVAVIIGGGGYLGSAMAGALAKAGVKVVIADKDIKKAEKVAVQLRKITPYVMAYAFDVTKKEAHEGGLSP